MTEARRSRRKRGSLSPEEIVAGAMHLLDSEGDLALTFARLGQELQASPTAVYRHFASRHDLIRAIADHLDGLSLDGYVPSDDWRVDLEDLAWRAWHTAVAHPAAASLSLALITNGPNELRAVEAVLRALHHAGLNGREAVLHYQLYGNFVLDSAAAQGALLSLDLGGGQGGWVQVYSPTDPAAYPYAEAVKSELRHIDHAEVFGRQVQIFLDALAKSTAANAALVLDVRSRKVAVPRRLP